MMCSVGVFLSLDFCRKYKKSEMKFESKPARNFRWQFEQNGPLASFAIIDLVIQSANWTWLGIPSWLEEEAIE